MYWNSGLKFVFFNQIFFCILNLNPNTTRNTKGQSSLTLLYPILCILLPLSVNHWALLVQLLKYPWKLPSPFHRDYLVSWLRAPPFSDVILPPSLNRPFCLWSCLFLIHTQHCDQCDLSLKMFVTLLSLNTSRNFSLFTAKGTISIVYRG